MHSEHAGKKYRIACWRASINSSIINQIKDFTTYEEAASWLQERLQGIAARGKEAYSATLKSIRILKE